MKYNEMCEYVEKLGYDVLLVQNEAFFKDLTIKCIVDIDKIILNSCIISDKNISFLLAYVISFIEYYDAHQFVIYEDTLYDEKVYDKAVNLLIPGTLNIDMKTASNEDIIKLTEELEVSPSVIAYKSLENERNNKKPKLYVLKND